MASNSTQVADQAKSNRRSAPRTSVPSIKIRYDGEIYAVEDWSVSGCRVVNYDGELRPGSTAIVEILLFVDRENEGLPAIAEVVRFEPENNNTLALHFRELRPRDLVDYCKSVEEHLAAQVDMASG